MSKFKAMVGSWPWRRIIFVASGAIGGFGIAALVRYLAPLDGRDIGYVAAAVLLVPTLSFRLVRSLTGGVLPVGRVKHTVEMPLIEVINEFTDCGYRVEAMTDNVVVLVRFSFRHLWLGLPLFVGISVIPAVVAALLEGANTNDVAVIAIAVPVYAFMVVYMYTIVGFGYDRIVFHQETSSGPSHCITTKNAFLPSRVDLAISCSEDHRDEDWYRSHPDRL